MVLTLVYGTGGSAFTRKQSRYISHWLQYAHPASTGSLLATGWVFYFIQTRAAPKRTMFGDFEPPPKAAGPFSNSNRWGQMSGLFRTLLFEAWRQEHSCRLPTSTRQDLTSGVTLANTRPRQQHRPSSQSVEKEDATRRHLPRDEAP